MSKHRIECIQKADRSNPWERITHLGGTNPDGMRWRLAQEDAISGLEAGKWSFFVRVGRQEANVIIKISRYGHKYLTTEADGEQPDNLLSLPECA